MTKPEITNNRPKNYSIWHRKLPDWCYMTDGDFFEQRKKGEMLVSVAYIETIEIDDPYGGNKTHPLWPSKKSLMFEIEEKMKIPAYIVWHNSTCDKFLVKRISDYIEPRKMSEREYNNFLMSLGNYLSGFFSNR